MAFLISLRIARSATFLKSQRISGYERISGHEKSLPVSQHRSTLLLPPDRQGFSDFCAGSASALKLRTRGARPTTRHLRRNWVQGVSPGRGEPAPLSAISGGIGSKASALVAGSPPHYPPPPAELGPGHSPGRGEHAPLSVTSGGIGSRASALVAGSPPHYPSPPAELGPGRQPWSRGARPTIRHLRRNWVQGVSPGVRGPCAGSPASGDSAGFQKCRGACPLPVRGPRP